MKISTFILTQVLLWAAMQVHAIPPPDRNSWLMGYWYVVKDEDHTVADWSEFQADGTYNNIAPNCSRYPGRWHLYGGDIYITFIVPGKGPIALVFRPNAERTQLTYTSPRTRNNAVMEKVNTVKCRPG